MLTFYDTFVIFLVHGIECFNWCAFKGSICWT